MPAPTVSKKHIQKFFEYAQERYRILLRRRRGEAPPWTQDPVLANWRFTNVFREDDATTIWFRDNIRDKLKRRPAVIMATIAFRWFNRIETGELIKPFLLQDNYDLARMELEIRARKAGGNPTVTGAYVVKTPHGMDKIAGILWMIQQAKLREPVLLKWYWHTPHAERTQESLWHLLQTLPYMGEFTGNEVVVDLTHTDMLEDAPDLMTWTNPGPGAALGLGLLLHQDPKAYDRHSKDDRKAMLDIMKVLLEASKDDDYWPRDWPDWTLHTVQFNLCEVSKWLRGQAGQQLKRRYRSDNVTSTECA